MTLPCPRRAALTLLAALAACSEAAPAASRLPAEGDALILQQVLDGALAPAAGLEQVARSGGWPIRTSQGYLFAVLDGGVGPYALASPSGAFPQTAMRTEAGVAWVLLPIPAPEGARYGYLSRFGDPVADGWSRRYAYQGAEEVSLVAAAGPHLERWPGLGGPGIRARTVRAWVPAQPPTHFLYVHDGQNLFDPGAPYGGWRLDLAAGPATLVVGIDNSPDRLDEYTQVPDTVTSPPGGRAAAYVDYLVQVVLPFVEAPARYGPPRRRGVMGSSLGGLVSFYAPLRSPGTFDFAASLSGTMGWGSIGGGSHQRTLIEDYQSLGACPDLALYLDSGGGPGPAPGCLDSDGDGLLDDAPGADDNYCENAQLAEVLTTLGCGPRLTSAWAQGAAHNEAAWRARSPAILDLFEAL